MLVVSSMLFLQSSLSTRVNASSRVSGERERGREKVREESERGERGSEWKEGSWREKVREGREEGRKGVRECYYDASIYVHVNSRKKIVN